MSILIRRYRAVAFFSFTVCRLYIFHHVQALFFIAVLLLPVFKHIVHSTKIRSYEGLTLGLPAELESLKEGKGWKKKKKPSCT